MQPRFERFEVIGTFNPAAIEFDDGVVLLVRVAERPTETREGYVALPYWNWQRGGVAIDWRRKDEVEPIDPRMVRIKSSGQIRLTFLSWLLVAFSRDGLTIDSFGDEAFLPANRYETFGVEDPRLTRIDDRFYFTYVAVSEHGVATSLASTADFKSFERHGIIFCPENKDVVLFPEKIDGQYVALHRPTTQALFQHPRDLDRPLAGSLPLGEPPAAVGRGSRVGHSEDRWRHAADPNGSRLAELVSRPRQA